MKNNVPFTLKLSYIFNPFFWFGLVFTAMGMLFSSIFVSPRILNDGKLNSQHIVTKGVLVDIAETSASVNNASVFEFVYEYTTPEKETITSYSYSTGFFNLQAGDSVNVQIHPQNPYLSRIEGMRTTQFGAMTIFVLIFPFIGIIMLFIGISVAVSKSKILTYGKPAWGKLVRQRDTGVRINNAPQFRLTYEFQTVEGRSFEASIKTHKIDTVIDDEFERLLYYSNNPRKILLMDNQPHRIKRFMYETFPEFRAKPE